ncbi:MAG TPA: class I SAM-dependent methyltransferase [Terriglobia bacterium]|nr:class I SAM-dependent methyltransferase [Terriglobia bacterium]
MGTDYDLIAEQYKRSKLSPWRTYIEQHTMLELLGDVREKSVLDLACGEGYYSRIFKRLGARRVVGIDLSAKMIELARGSESQSPLGVEYVISDAIDYQPDEPFDIVTAGYLLNYADTCEKLLAMCQAVSRSLRAGGRFVTANNNPFQSPQRFAATEKYGFTKSAAEDLRAGTPITYTIFQDGGTFTFDNYYLSAGAHEEALRAVGLRDIEWIPPRLSPHWSEDPAFWDNFFDDPSVIFLQCRK